MRDTFRRFVFVVFDRMRLIVMVFLAVSLISTAIAMMVPSVYCAIAKFSWTDPAGLNPLQQEYSFDYRNRIQRVFQDQRELILSSRVLTKAFQQLTPAIPLPVSGRQVDALRENLDVILPEGENFESTIFFVLEYRDESPVRAAQMAAAVTRSYLDVYQELSNIKSDSAVSFFLEQTQKRHKDMIDKENKLSDFETRQALALIEILSIESVKEKQSFPHDALLVQFLRYHDALQTELTDLWVSIEYLEREINKKGRTGLPGHAISVFKSRLSQLDQQLNEMKPQLGETQEPLKLAEKESSLGVDSLKKETKRSIKAQKINSENIDARIQQLEKNIRDLKGRIQTTVREKAIHENLKQEYKITKELYMQSRLQLEQARTAQSVNQGKPSLTLIDNPELPLKPIKPNRLLLIVGGLFSGFFLGIAVAMIMAHFDHRLKTVCDIETHLKAPVLGSIQNVQ